MARSSKRKRRTPYVQGRDRELLNELFKMENEYEAKCFCDSRLYEFSPVVRRAIVLRFFEEPKTTKEEQDEAELSLFRADSDGLIRGGRRAVNEVMELVERLKKFGR